MCDCTVHARLYLCVQIMTDLGKQGLNLFIVLNSHCTTLLMFACAVLPENSRHCGLSCMQAVKKEVDTAVSDAKNSPVPEAEELWHNIYKDPLGSSVKGLDSKTHIKL